MNERETNIGWTSSNQFSKRTTVISNLCRCGRKLLRKIDYVQNKLQGSYQDSFGTKIDKLKEENNKGKQEREQKDNGNKKVCNRLKENLL
jgi:hypothetical protein